MFEKPFLNTKTEKAIQSLHIMRLLIISKTLLAPSLRYL